MKIVVLAGGLSPERNVSLSSGIMICQALRSRGHQAAFVDLFFGTEGCSGALEELFSAPLPEDLRRVSRQAPDLQEIKKSRKCGGGRGVGAGGVGLCGPAAAGVLCPPRPCGGGGRGEAAPDHLWHPRNTRAAFGRGAAAV